MAEKTEKVTGGRLCGAVRYEATGDPLPVIHCHCSRLSAARRRAWAIPTEFNAGP